VSGGGPGHDALQVHLEGAVELMEAGRWTDAAALLLGLLATARSDPATDPRLEPVAGALMAQVLAERGELDAARRQAAEAVAAAGRCGDRDTVHRCLALLASLDLLDHGRL
jgi:hypothetical protein